MNDRVMSAGDLKNDVARGMCTFYTVSNGSVVKEVSLKSFADALRKKGEAPKSKRKQSVQEVVEEAAVGTGGKVGGSGGGSGGVENRVVDVFEAAVGRKNKKSGSELGVGQGVGAGSSQKKKKSGSELGVGTGVVAGSNQKKKKSGSEPLVEKSTDTVRGAERPVAK